LRLRAVLAASENDDIPDRLEHVALVHIVRVEELSAFSSN
jgi:hypothetical protein